MLVSTITGEAWTKHLKEEAGKKFAKKRIILDARCCRVARWLKDAPG